MAKKPVVLIIRDGWGVNPGGKKTAEKDGNATLLAKTPFHDVMLEQYPKGLVSASGMDVGLPDGQMGNSEVGHLNLGAGRIVYQEISTGCPGKDRARPPIAPFSQTTGCGPWRLVRPAEALEPRGVVGKHKRKLDCPMRRTFLPDQRTIPIIIFTLSSTAASTSAAMGVAS